MKRIVLLALALVLITTGPAWAEMMSVGGKRINFRQGPSTSKSVVYQAERYYPVKIVGNKGGWVKTKDFEGETAWVLKRLLSKTKCLVVKAPKANVRSHARTKNSKILFTAGRGAAFKIIRREGKWYLVQHADGDRGWIHRSLVWAM